MTQSARPKPTGQFRRTALPKGKALQPSLISVDLYIRSILFLSPSASHLKRWVFRFGETRAVALMSFAGAGS